MVLFAVKNGKANQEAFFSSFKSVICLSLGCEENVLRNALETAIANVILTVTK